MPVQDEADQVEIQISPADDLRSLIKNRSRYLQKLKEKQALLGLDKPPSVMIQIEDIEQELAQLQAELNALKETVEPLSEPVAPPVPAPALPPSPRGVTDEEPLPAPSATTPLLVSKSHSLPWLVIGGGAVTLLIICAFLLWLIGS